MAPFLLLLRVYELHLLDEPLGPCVLVNDEQDIANIHHNIPADPGVIVDVAHGPFPNPVEIEPDEVTPGVKCRAPRISTSGMVGRNEADGHLAVHSVLAIVL